MTNSYWADDYVTKKLTAQQAVAKIKPGQRVFIGSSCGEPQHLVRALAEASIRFTDIEIVHLLALETIPLTLIADKTKDRVFNFRSFYLGSGKPSRLAKNLRFITPINISRIPRLFRSKKMPIHVALIQVSPPDDFGWMSMGISVDITMAAAMAADVVIAQVNSKMPRVLGRSFIHVNDVNFIVEYDEDLITIKNPPEMESANEIGRLIERLIDDGSTIHIGPGATLNATLLGLSEKNDLGVHTEYITDGIMSLVSKGVINNKKKGFNDGKLVASGAIGTENLYEFLDDNPSVDFEPSDYVSNPSIIARHNKMVSMNVAMAMDLTGQVAADAMVYNHFTGVNGMLDFVRGATMSEEGRSIIMLASTWSNGTKSAIVPMLDDIPVLVPRGDAHYVVTEYGAVNLFGKSLQDRARAMISIAHPDFRDELFQKARDIGLLGQDRSLAESIKGVYPRKLEQVFKIDGQRVTVRPAKPVDERRIQEHFYNLNKDDVIARFFYEKTSFLHNEIEGVSQVDYVKDLTVVAIVGEFGFGKVIAVGEYLLEKDGEVAEVAFSVNNQWQGKGLGSILMKTLLKAAMENKIEGFVAYTYPSNRGMIKLFNTLPFNIKTAFEDEMIKLTCKFADEKKTS